MPQPRSHVKIAKPRKRLGAKPGRSQVHDEDVLRWELSVPEADAVAVARQAGQGAPVLPVTHLPPTLSPAHCRTATAYINVLPEDVRHSLYRHCEQISRNERLVLEGQERLKYVQACVREMKARMPPPPPPPPPLTQMAAARGPVPQVEVIPVAQPSCWASCFGLAGPPPDAAFSHAHGQAQAHGGQPPMQYGPPPQLAAELVRLAPVAVPLPPPQVFTEAALAGLEARRRAASAGGAISVGGAGRRSVGGATSTPLHAVGSSVGGASDAPPPPPPRTPPEPLAGQQQLHAAFMRLEGQGQGVREGVLPGEAARRTRSSGGGDVGAPAAVLAPPAAAAAGARVAGGAGLPPSQSPPPQPPAAARAVRFSGTVEEEDFGAGASGGGAADTGPRPTAMMPPLQGKAPGAPQSLLRPLAPMPAKKLPGLAPLPQAGLGAGSAPGQAGSVLPPPTQQQQQPSSPYDLSRYQNPESLRKLAHIQATQRGRMARRDVALMRATRGVSSEQQQQQKSPPPHAGGPAAAPARGAVAGGKGGKDVLNDPLLAGLGESPAMDLTFGTVLQQQAGGGGRAVEQRQQQQLQQPAPAVHPFMDPAHGGQGPGAPPFDLARYQDPAVLRKVTRIQAAERGRRARKEVAQMKAARGPAAQQQAQAQRGGVQGRDPLLDEWAGLVEGHMEATVGSAVAAAVRGAGPGAGDEDPAPYPTARAAAAGAAASAGAPSAPLSPPYDLARYQDPETLRQVTRIQAAERGRRARREVAQMRAGRVGGA